MKKILIAKQSLEKTYSGACRSVHEEIRYFKNLGYEVHTVAEDSNDKDIMASGAIPHKSFRWPWQKKFKRRIQFSNQSKKIAQKIKADMIIGHGDYQNPDIHLIHNCVHLAHEKIHGTPLSKDNEMYKTHTPIFQNRQFKHIIANSIIAKDELVRRFGINELQISVIYPAVDENQFRPLPIETRKNKREELGVKDDEFLVGLITSGNFKKRGVDRFFEAISKLPPHIGNKTHFIFVGKDKLTPQYQAILDACPYKDRVRLLPIIDDVEIYFNALDIFVLPARIEEFGRVVAEAMACGSPIITTEWVGASELLDDESKEFIYSGEDNQELSDLMVKLLSDSDLRKNISDLNIKSASKVFESKLSDEFNKVFSSFLD
jgi:UDP-glucose:(heptosyl)LPS alpha-1,3-glucosyltransferase